MVEKGSGDEASGEPWEQSTQLDEEDQPSSWLEGYPPISVNFDCADVVERSE